MKVQSLVGIFLLVTALAMASPEKHKHERWQPQGETVTKTFQVNQGGNLEVSLRAGDIIVKSWNKNEIHVVAEGIDANDKDNLLMDQFGGNVEVRFRPEESEWARFTIQTPTNFNIDLNTSGGDMELQGTFRGRLEGHTSGGDIRLGDVDGNVSMSTSGGDVSAGKIVGSVSLRTSGGDIDVTNAGGEVEVHTSGGDINVGNVGKSLVARTAGGDVIVGDVGGEARISTAGGDVRVGKVTGSASMETAGGDVELQGATGAIKARTAGGDIALRNVSGSVTSSTAGGDIIAELRPTGSGQSRLSSAGGDVTLFLPQNAKATIEAIIDIDGRWAHMSEDYEIRSDFKADTYEKDAQRKEIRATYVLNGGGERILLETNNSNIYIRTLR